MQLARKLWNIFTTAIVILVAVVAIVLVGARLAGMQLFTVLSGSMEPAFHVGGLIVVMPTEPTELQVGDPITFLLDEDTVATHRIVGIVLNEKGELTFRTKGDANDAPDGGVVHYKNVIGKAIFTVPYLGYVTNYIQHPPGLYIAVACCALLLLLSVLPGLFPRAEENEEG